MSGWGRERPQVRVRPMNDQEVLLSRDQNALTVYTNPARGRVSRTNFTSGTYLEFRARSQCRNPSTVTTPSSGRRSEVSLFIDMEESKRIGRAGGVTAYEGLGIAICNMLISLCRTWSEGRLSRTVRLSA